MQKRNTRMLVVYLAIVFAISTIFYILIDRGGGLESVGPGYVVLLMWTPAVAGLTTTLIFQRNARDVGWRVGKPIFYLIAFMLPIVYAGIVYGAVWLLDLGEVDAGILGDNLVGELVSTLTVGVLGAALLALGEEIGWRGVLVPQLANWSTFAHTAIISGLIWGVWHLPLIVGGGYSSGAPTWYASACFLVSIVGFSFAFAWLRLASGSIWPAVLLHATHNTFIQGVLDKITIDSGNTEYFTTEFGLGLAIMGLITGLIFWRIGLPNKISEAPIAPTTPPAQ